MSDNNNNNNDKFHEYDGIIEHDNPLPMWWLWTFFLTIIFSFIYFIHYELAGGQTQAEELAAAMAEIEQAQSKAHTSSPMETEDSLKAAFGKDGMLALGESQYTSKCASCHGAQLQGLIGPNLADKFWLHGKGSRMDIVKVIRDGVAEKGMPPWGPVMKKDEIYAVSAFILAKRGTQAPDAKEPQGDAVEDYLTAQ